MLLAEGLLGFYRRVAEQGPLATFNWTLPHGRIQFCHMVTYMYDPVLRNQKNCDSPGFSFVIEIRHVPPGTGLHLNRCLQLNSCTTRTRSRCQFDILNLDVNFFGELDAAFFFFFFCADSKR